MRPKLYLIILLFAFFTSCKKNDTQPNIETIQLGIIVGNDTTISPSVLKEPFNLISSNESIATAEKLDGEIKITAHKVGYTEITITDQNKKNKV